MRASFMVMAPGQVLLSEDRLAGFGDMLPKALDDLQYRPGRLAVRDGEGAVLGGWVDTFSILVPSLCLEGATALARGVEYVYDFESFDEQARLSVTEGRAVVEGAEFGRFDCDRAELVQALVDCGSRFVELMSHLPDEGDDSLMTGLREKLAEAQAAAAALSGAL
jgi:hypothetical protein